MGASLPVPIDLKDGRTRALRFGSSAISRAEAKFEYRPFGQMVDCGVSNYFVQTLLWAGLLWQEPGLTWEQAGELIDHYTEETSRTYVDLTTPIFEALIEAGVFKRQAKPNGHDPNAVTEKGPSTTAPSPSGSTT
jgi:hypothetical protein